jgi:hypothetical protein
VRVDRADAAIVDEGTRPERPPRARAWCVVGLCLVAALLAPVCYEILGGVSVALPKIFRSGDDLGRVLARQHYERNVSIYIGIAASDAASGRADTIFVPRALDTLAVRAGDRLAEEDRSAFLPQFMTRASGARIEPADYATVLTAAQLAALRAAYTERSYPWDVVAFIGKSPSKRAVLYTDAGKRTVYVVPFPASTLGGAR